MEKEIHRRSVLKSFLWRILGVLILGTIAYLYTRQWIQTTIITFLHHGIFLFVFYIHERIWLKLKWPKFSIGRSFAKMFTYETICGNLILGAITYLVTGSWKQMTAITFTYIGIKHIVYIFNEELWKKIHWGKIKGEKISPGFYKIVTQSFLSNNEIWIVGKLTKEETMQCKNMEDVGKMLMKKEKVVKIINLGEGD